jgi:hypothetical protein
LFNKDLAKEISFENFTSSVERSWVNDEVRYSVQRVEFCYLPANKIARISKDHANITGRRKNLETLQTQQAPS